MNIIKWLKKVISQKKKLFKKVISRKKSSNIQPQDCDEHPMRSVVVHCDDLFVSAKHPYTEFDYVNFMVTGYNFAAHSYSYTRTNIFL